MTEDKQIEAAYREWFESSGLVEETYGMIWAFKAGYKAAIAASYAKYVPELVEALKKIALHTEWNDYLQREDMTEQSHMAAEALAKLPEELRG